LKECR